MMALQKVSEPTTMLDAALDYAEAGLAVFPCKADKTPYTLKGVKDASTDPAQITRWWTNWPHAMIGMAMGKASGVWALDPDAPKGDGPDGVANWRRLVAENGDDVLTYTNDTPGGGQHLLFEYDDTRPVGNSPGALKSRGIDVRGNGGYIIVPPSVNADGRAYKIAAERNGLSAAPEWLYDLILTKAPAPAEAPPATIRQQLDNVVQLQTVAVNERNYSEVALKRECDALAAVGKGDRNASLNTAAFKLGQLVGPGRLEETEVRTRLEQAAAANGLEADGKAAVLKTINSGLYDGMKQPRVIPERAHDTAAKPSAAPAATVKPFTIRATPYVFKLASLIPCRQWLYGKHLIRRFASATIAPGGVGKSSLVLTDALAMATGRDLIGMMPTQRCRVWCWNGEDPTDEMDRRIAAICIHYGIKREDVEGWLFTDSGRDQEIIIASQTRDGAVVAQPVAAAIIEAIRANQIDVLSIDPFISSHRVTENDNNAIDLVAKEWARIADVTNCAIELVHHTRKTNGAEATVEDGRGAGALKDAVRSARVLNVMDKKLAKEAGMTGHRSYFKVENGKANLSPPPDGADWFQIKSVALGNGEPSNPFDTGDSVGVVIKWKWLDPLDGITGTDFDKAAAKIKAGSWRENVQAKAWVGNAIADALGLDLEKDADKAKVKGIARAWIAAGTLVVVEGETENREKKKFVEVAEDA